ncbi:general stress protein [Bacillus cytotoxicus]|uniref:general stress protein n=1 Tax=Bacillus cereus group TaxID=86661 RepID=UPI000B97B0DC|nr:MULTISPECIES: general stress protein [Bacillus cereus group]AWC31013.1 general stress protein [Bacillus cytotoxicus]AWC35039.1 general stress protein [Bacillus cytotoxicus]AWC39078.1 general stress protein [Bacillus cytotoxicus]AWC43105.1 general stress protein [Bacillus cytotoxicus]AWC46982.1 general stress protein [Bacillus cytotoxicus]
MNKFIGMILGLTLSSVLSIGLASPTQLEAKKHIEPPNSNTIMYLEASHGDSW